MVTKPGKSCELAYKNALFLAQYIQPQSQIFLTLRMKQSLQGITLIIRSLIKLLCFQILPHLKSYELGLNWSAKRVF